MLLYFSSYNICLRKHKKVIATRKHFLIHTQAQKFPSRIKNLFFRADEVRFSHSLQFQIFGATLLFRKDK
jgi:hypothetical protein